MRLPRIAVTMGDPAGIGPEICLRLLSDEAIRGCCVPVVFGDADVLAQWLAQNPYDVQVSEQLASLRSRDCHSPGSPAA